MKPETIKRSEVLAGLANTSKASQDNYELFMLLLALDSISPKVIVEIGVHRGFSLLTWLEAFNPDILVGIENNVAEFDQAAKRAGLHTNVIVGDSHQQQTKDELLARLDGKLIDFLFIDGDHTYNGTMQDFEMYSSLVRPGGVVAIHDVMRLPGQYEGVETRAVFDHLKNRYPNAEYWNATAEGGAPGVGLLIL